jgi:lipopolysaccharide biosynthesis regulator YciM
MIDPITMTLAANAVAVVTPLVMKGAEKIAEELGGYAAEKIKGVLNSLKSRFSKNKEAEESLQRFEEKPDRSTAAVVKDYLQELKSDKEFAAELQKLLQDVKKSKPEIEVYIKNVSSKIVTGFDLGTVEGGKFKADIQDVRDADEVVGFKADRVG